MWKKEISHGLTIDRHFRRANTLFSGGGNSPLLAFSHRPPGMQGLMLSVLILISQARNKSRQCRRVETALCSKCIRSSVMTKRLSTCRAYSVPMCEGGGGRVSAGRGHSSRSSDGQVCSAGTENAPERQFIFTRRAKEFVSSTLIVTSLNKC